MGAQTSDTVHNLLVSQKIIDAKKINVLPKKTVAKVEEAAPSADATALPLEDSALASVASAEGATSATEEVPAETSEDNAVADETPAE